MPFGVKAFEMASFVVSKHVPTIIRGPRSVLQAFASLDTLMLIKKQSHGSDCVSKATSSGLLLPIHYIARSHYFQRHRALIMRDCLVALFSDLECQMVGISSYAI